MSGSNVRLPPRPAAGFTITVVALVLGAAVGSRTGAAVWVAGNPCALGDRGRQGRARCTIRCLYQGTCASRSVTVPAIVEIDVVDLRRVDRIAAIDERPDHRFRIKSQSEVR